MFVESDDAFLKSHTYYIERFSKLLVRTKVRRYGTTPRVARHGTTPRVASLITWPTLDGHYI
jgi:hypothetical protein